jgi:hypothetical protein
MHSKKALLIGGALCAVILIISLFALLYPTYSVDYTDRAEIIKIMNDQHDSQGRIVERLKNKMPMDLSSINRSAGNLYTVEVSSFGVMHIYHIRTKTNIYLEPKLLSNGDYKWSCHGDKPFNLPIDCRP